MTVRPASQTNKPKAIASQSAAKKPVAKRSKVDEAIASLYGNIPKDMRVIGMSGVVGDTDRQVILQLKKTENSPQRYIHVPVVVMATAANGNTTKLKDELFDKSYFDLPEEKGGVMAMAKAIMKEAQTKNVKIFTESGLNIVNSQGDECKAYVWGNQAYWFGKKPAERVLIFNSAQSPQSSGTLESWQETIGVKMLGNHRFIVLACHSLSAAIRGYFGRPYTAISLVGETSRGKSTCQYIMQSLSGEIAKVMSMVGTEAGLAKELAGKKNVVACFEDVHLFGAENLMHFIFRSVEGSTHLKIGNKDGAQSSVLILSSEKLLADMKNAAGAISGGIYARLLEITFLPENGVFDNLHGAEDGATFSTMLEKSCGKNYGTVWPAWLDELSLNWDQVLELYEAWMLKIKSALIKRIGESTTDPVTNRLLNELVFSAFSGCLAAKFGILTKISRNEILDAFALVMKEHLARKRTEHSDDGPAVIAAVRGLLDENAGKFPKLDYKFRTNPTSGIYGFRYECAKHGVVYLFLPSVFLRLIDNRFEGSSYAHLKKAGFLVTSKGRGNQYQIRMPATFSERDIRKSFVAIRKSIMFDEKM